jgi:hypothetical protein
MVEWLNDTIVSTALAFAEVMEECICFGLRSVDRLACGYWAKKNTMVGGAHVGAHLLFSTG